MFAFAVFYTVRFTLSPNYTNEICGVINELEDSEEATKPGVYAIGILRESDVRTMNSQLGELG